MGRVTTAQKSTTMAAAATMSPSLPESGLASKPRQPSRCCPLLPDWCFIGGGGRGGKGSRLGKVSQVILGAVINLALLGLFVLHFYRNGFKHHCVEWYMCDIKGVAVGDPDLRGHHPRHLRLPP